MFIEPRVSNLATLEGRQLLQRYWSDSIVSQRRWKMPTSISCLKLSMFGRALYLSSSEQPVSVDHSLGIRLGFRVWMEEIIYKHFANTIQALVYLGAVVLLAFVGLRFANLIDERRALIGIGLEAAMLFLLFVVIYFTPEEEYLSIGPTETRTAGDDAKAYVGLFREIYDELQDIGTMNAALGRHLTEIANKQEQYLRELSQRPNIAPGGGGPITREGLAELASLNQTFRELITSVGDMNSNVERLLGKEVEYYVRREVERVLAQSVGQIMSNTHPGSASVEAGGAGHEASSAPNP